MRTLLNKFFKTAIISLLVINFQTVFAQSIREYREAHSRLLAKQTNVKDKIRVEEAHNYARTLYGDKSASAITDISDVGWDSGLVNPYQDSDVPQTKVLDVSQYSMPVKHRVITSHFGYRRQFGRMHKGVDLKASIGDTISAAFSGRVRITKFERAGYGFYVVIRHDNGMETVYGHLSKFLVKQGQYVKVGQPIALSGNTGRSTGPHLHFETRYMGVAINPEKIFDFVNGCTYHTHYTFNKNSGDNANNNRQVASGGTNKPKSSTRRRRR